MSVFRLWRPATSGVRRATRLVTLRATVSAAPAAMTAAAAGKPLAASSIKSSFGGVRAFTTTASKFGGGGASHAATKPLTITFVELNGTRHKITDAKVGETLHNAAQRNDIFIPNPCTGTGLREGENYDSGAGCRYCHVYIANEFIDKLPAVESNEEENLKDLQAGRKTNSRLSCQIELTPALDGMVVALPKPDDPDGIDV